MDNKPRILITGASGFIGSKVSNILSRDYEVLGTYLNNYRSDLIHMNVVNLDEVNAVLKNFKPQIIFHAASLIGVETCEKNKKKARKIIVEGTKNLVDLIRGSKTGIIYTSTAYVFNGSQGNHKETDKPNPSTFYGQLKLEAESNVLELERSIVLRFDMPYGVNETRKSSGIISELLESKRLDLYQGDQIRSPIWIDDLAYITLQLIDKEVKGIFNVATRDLSKRELFQDLGKLIRKESLIHESKEQKSRPNNTTLDTTKIRDLGIHIHSYKESLNQIREQLKYQ